jgi:hypothetical protein
MMAHVHRWNAIVGLAAGWIAVLGLMAVVAFGASAVTGQKKAASEFAPPEFFALNQK